MSPPLFLMQTLIVAHLVELAGLSPLRSVAVALRALFKAVTIIAAAGLVIGIVGS